MARGYSTKLIARELGLAVGTVKVHLAAIYRLLGAHNRTEAVARLVNTGSPATRADRRPTCRSCSVTWAGTRDRQGEFQGRQRRAVAAQPPAPGAAWIGQQAGTEGASRHWTIAKLDPIPPTMPGSPVQVEPRTPPP